MKKLKVFYEENSKLGLNEMLKYKLKNVEGEKENIKFICDESKSYDFIVDDVLVDKSIHQVLDEKIMKNIYGRNIFKAILSIVLSIMMFLTSSDIMNANKDAPGKSCGNGVTEGYQHPQDLGMRSASKPLKGKVVKLTEKGSDTSQNGEDSVPDAGSTGEESEVRKDFGAQSPEMQKSESQPLVVKTSDETQDQSEQTTTRVSEQQHGLSETQHDMLESGAASVSAITSKEKDAKVSKGSEPLQSDAQKSSLDVSAPTPSSEERGVSDEEFELLDKEVLELLNASELEKLVFAFENAMWRKSVSMEEINAKWNAIAEKVNLEKDIVTDPKRMYEQLLKQLSPLISVEAFMEAQGLNVSDWRILQRLHREISRMLFESRGGDSRGNLEKVKRGNLIDAFRLLGSESLDKCYNSIVTIAKFVGSDVPFKKEECEESRSAYVRLYEWLSLLSDRFEERECKSEADNLCAQIREKIGSNEEPSPIPVVTDWKERCENVKKDLENKGFKLEPSSGVMIDLCNPENTIASLCVVLQSGMAEKTTSQASEELAIKSVLLKHNVNFLITKFQKLRELKEMSFENEAYRVAYWDALSQLSLTIERSKGAFLEAKDEFFVGILRHAQKMLLLPYVRYYFDAWVAENGAYIAEKIMTRTREVAGHLSLEVPIPDVPGLTLGSEISKSTSLERGDALFTVTKTKGGESKLSYNLANFDFSIGFGVEEVNSVMFYSLEAYLDYLLSRDSSALDKVNALMTFDMRDALSKRDKLRQVERQALVVYQTFGDELKLFNVFPNNTRFKILELTRAKAYGKTKEQTVSGKVSIDAQVGDILGAGVTLSASSGLKTYISETPLLSLIDEDCSVKGRMIDLENSIDKKYRLQKYEDGFEKVQDEEKIHILAVDLWNDLNSYVRILETLEMIKLDMDANKLEDMSKKYKEMEFKKKESEKHLLGFSGVVDVRKGVLNAAILMAAKLRRASIDNESIFRKIYSQLQRLSQLCEFCANNSGWRKIFNMGPKIQVRSEAFAVSKILTASAECKIGDTELTVELERSNTTGSPLEDENGKNITLSFSIPLEWHNKIEALSGFINWFHRWFKEDADPSDDALRDLKLIISDFKMEAVNNLMGLIPDIPESEIVSCTKDIGMSESAETKYVWGWVDSVDTRDMKPLPGLELIKDDKKGRYILNYASMSTNKELSASVGADISGAGAVEGGISYSRGRVAEVTGTNTLSYLSSRFSAIKVGEQDSPATAKQLLDSLLENQGGQLERMFYRIGQGAKIKKSPPNVALELQVLYNALLDASVSPIKDIYEKTDEVKRRLDAARHLAMVANVNFGSETLAGIGKAVAAAATTEKVDADTLKAVEIDANVKEKIRKLQLDKIKDNCIAEAAKAAKTAIEAARRAGRAADEAIKMRGKTTMVMEATVAAAKERAKNEAMVAAQAAEDAVNKAKKFLDETLPERDENMQTRMVLVPVVKVARWAAIVARQAKETIDKVSGMSERQREIEGKFKEFVSMCKVIAGVSAAEHEVSETMRSVKGKGEESAVVLMGDASGVIDEEINVIDNTETMLELSVVVDDFVRAKNVAVEGEQKCSTVSAVNLQQGSESSVEMRKSQHSANTSTGASISLPNQQRIPEYQQACELFKQILEMQYEMITKQQYIDAFFRGE